MSDANEPERISLDDLSFEEAVEVVQEVFGFDPYWATVYVSKSRGEVGEGLVQEDEEGEG